MARLSPCSSRRRRCAPRSAMEERRIAYDQKHGRSGLFARRARARFAAHRRRLAGGRQLELGWLAPQDARRLSMDLRLYFSPGACSRVPMIALEEIGQPFDTRLVAFMKGEHRTAEYLALNPAGKVPLLVADGRPVTQNVAI